VPVNDHPLADFRSHPGDALDDLLTDHVASLMAAGAVKLKAAAQDGMRVRASEGAASFRREEKLKACLEVAREQVSRLKAPVDDDPVGETARKQAAQRRAAEEREARIEAALARLPERAAIKQGQGKDPKEARASTTDADATVMKRGDGGFQPAFNFQYATDIESQVIIGVEVVTAGSDQGQRSPMVEQVSERCGQTPESWRVDGGYPGMGNSTRLLGRPPSMRPCRRPKTRQSTFTKRRQRTARRWLNGGNVWEAMRPRRSTRIARRLPNG